MMGCFLIIIIINGVPLALHLQNKWPQEV